MLALLSSKYLISYTAFIYLSIAVLLAAVHRDPIVDSQIRPLAHGQ